MSTRNGPVIRVTKGHIHPRRPLSVWIEEYGHNQGEERIAEPIVMRPLKEGELSEVKEPTMNLSNEAAQTLIDDLWTAGLRPSEGTGSAGSLAATQKHLADMRIIAFDKLKIKEVMK